jgi:hypothetical protein
MLQNKILHSNALRLLASHSRQAKDTKQLNKNNSFDWFIQNINTIALVEPVCQPGRLYEGIENCLA